MRFDMPIYHQTFWGANPTKDTWMITIFDSSTETNDAGHTAMFMMQILAEELKDKPYRFGYSDLHESAIQNKWNWFNMFDIYDYPLKVVIEPNDKGSYDVYRLINGADYLNLFYQFTTNADGSARKVMSMYGAEELPRTPNFMSTIIYT